MYRNLYPKSSFRSCPYTVLVKCPVRFYSIFDEIGQNVDGKMYFYHRSHCSTTTTESNGSLFSSLAPANGYAQKNCAERFSALKLTIRVTHGSVVRPSKLVTGRSWVRFLLWARKFSPRIFIMYLLLSISFIIIFY